MSRCSVISQVKFKTFTDKLTKLANELYSAYSLPATEKATAISQKNNEIILHVDKFLDDQSRELSSTARAQLVNQILGWIKQSGKLSVAINNLSQNNYYFNKTQLLRRINNFRNNIKPNTFKVDSLQDLDNKPQIAKEVNNEFFDRLFGSAVDYKIAFKKKMQYDFINAIILDTENLTVVKGPQSINDNIRNYQEKLFQLIVNFIKSTPRWASEYKDKYSETPLLMFDDKGRLTEGFHLIMQDASQLLYLDSDNLAYMHANFKGAKFLNPIKKSYPASIAYFMLNNFDQLLKFEFGKAIDISNFGDLNNATNDKYSMSSKGSNVYATWRTSDNIKVEQEVNNIVKLLIDNIQFYKYNTTEPEEGRYISFGDFGYIISKIKKLTDNIESSKLVFDNETLSDIGDAHLSKETEYAIEGKSLKDIIALILHNPQKYLPAAFEILSNPVIRSAKPGVFNEFSEIDRNLLYSIHRGIFDRTNKKSILSIVDAHNDDNPLDTSDYYSYITQTANSIYKVEFLQYYKGDDQVVRLRGLENQALDQLSREVEGRLNQASYINQDRLLGNYEVGLVNTENISSWNQQDKNKRQIAFTLLKDGNKEIRVIVNVGDGTWNAFRVKNNVATKYNFTEEDWNNETLRNNIAEILNYDIYPQTVRSNLLREKYQTASSLMNDLVTVCSDVLSMSYLNREIFNKEKNIRNVLKISKSYFGKDEKFNYETNQMSLVRLDHVAIIRSKFADVEASIKGLSTAVQVKDSEGNAQSTTTLSRLMGSLQSQWYRTNQDSRNPSSGYILHTPGVYQGIFTTKEANLRGLSKESTDFTAGEFIYSSFIHDFLGAFISDDSDRVIIKNGIAGFCPAVMSDKNTIAKILINLNAEIQIRANELGKSFMDIIKSGTWEEDLKQIIKNELGTYYQKMFDNVITDFAKLLEFDALSGNPDYKDIDEVRRRIKYNKDLIKRNKSELSKLDPVTDQTLRNYYSQLIQQKEEETQKLEKEIPYLEERLNQYKIDARKHLLNNFNDINRKYGLRTVNWLRDLVTRYNNHQDSSGRFIHRNNPIRLIDQTHFIECGGMLRANRTLLSLVGRFGDTSLLPNGALNIDEFFERKKKDLFLSLMNQGIEIDCNNDKQVELNILKQNTDWYNASSNKVILGKLHYKKVYDSLSKASIEYALKSNSKQSSLVYGIDNGNWVLITSEDLKDDKLKKYKKYVLVTTYNIYGKTDLQRIKAIIGKELGINHINDLLYSSDIDFELNDMIAKYNYLDFLFSQEFVTSSVGSHLNHPVKKYAKGKVVFSENSVFTQGEANGSNSIIDFDEIVKSENVGDDFKKKLDLFKTYKALANTQNKILHTSDTTILDQFSDDFDYIFIDSQALDIDKHTNFLNSFSDETVSDKVKKKFQVYEDFNSFEKVFTDLNSYSPLTEESDRYNAQNKRNVAYTAAMHAFQLNLVKGIPSEYNIAVIEDIRCLESNFVGNKEKVKSWDGATFVNPYIVHLENYALGGDAAGIDKKQFVHFYDDATGTGGIIKTAGFGWTNAKCRVGEGFRKLHKKMSLNIWAKQDGSMFVVNLAEQAENHIISFDNVFKQEKGVHYKLTNVESLGNNRYNVTWQECNNKGEVKEDGQLLQYDNVLINSNYELHRLYGMYNSETFNKETNQLELSEESILRVVEAINNITEGDVFISTTDENKVRRRTQEDIYQPLKHSDIHYIVTQGAMKQGIANMNPISALDDDSKLTYFKVKMLQSGIQLDKSHHASDSELSLMTQVINACAFNGFTFARVNELYKALADFSKLQTKDFDEAFEKIMNPAEGVKNNNALRDVVLESFIKQVAFSTSTTGSLGIISSVAKDLIDDCKKGKKIKFSDSTLSLSDPAIYNKFVQSIQSFLTSKGIKLKIPGNLAVLHPSEGLIGLHDGKLETDFTDYEGEISELLKQKDELPLFDNDNGKSALYESNGIQSIGNDNIANLRIGRSYKIWERDNPPRIVDLSDPSTYWELLQAIVNGSVTKISEDVTSPSKLATYNLKFYATSPNGRTRKFNMYDLTVVKDLFYLKDVIEGKADRQSLQYKSFINRYNKFTEVVSATNPNGGEYYTINIDSVALERYIRKNFQKTLDSISSSSTYSEPVSITEYIKDSNGIREVRHSVTVEKTSVEVEPYELIMPVIFRDEFGLLPGDSLYKIKNDPYFFAKRMLSKFTDNIGNPNLFKIELKRSNGNHLYLTDSVPPEATEVVVPRLFRDGSFLWTDNEGNTILELSSDKDKIYKTKNGLYIVETANLGHYLDNETYAQCLISTGAENAQHYYNIVKSSKNKVAQEYASWIDSEVKYLNSGKGKKTTATIKDAITRLSKNFYSIINNDNIDNDKDRLTFEKAIVDYQNKSYGRIKTIKSVLDHNETMYTSFLATLDILAARIPAQNQQSFMAMTTVAFETEDVNRAYVSSALLWLLGSKH